MAEEKKIEANEAYPTKGFKRPVVEERLQKQYREEIVPQLMKELNLTNVMECPKLVKIVLNMRVGKATSDSKAIEEAVSDMEAITGQKPIVTKAKKSIANFKLREGQDIGVKVTLRRNRMYDFFDKLVNICLPRVRDFHGVSDTSFDGRGNYTLGVKEQMIFPEVDFEKIAHTQGMDITIVTSAHDDKGALALLKALGMPFKR